MDEMLKDLHELCEMYGDWIHEAKEKLRRSANRGLVSKYVRLTSAVMPLDISRRASVVIAWESSMTNSRTSSPACSS